MAWLERPGRLGRRQRPAADDLGTAGTGPFADPAGVAGGPGCHWLLEGQAGRGGAVELVVDRDDVPAVGGEHGRGDRRPVAAVADHPHLARWHVAEPARQLVQRDVDSVGDVALRPLQATAHVQHDQGCGAGPPLRRPGRRGDGPVDADAGSRWASATCPDVSPSRVSGMPQGMSQPR